MSQSREELDVRLELILWDTDIPNRQGLIEHLKDFIIADRKRVVAPIHGYSLIKPSVATWDMARRAIDETLKNAGVSL